MITVEALRAVGATRAVAEECIEPIKAACAFYDINTPEREAAFLAQTGHESGGFLYRSEIWGPTPTQSRYEGRADLGNTQPGDGKRFKGHGFIQITGRFNHARVRDRLRERFTDVPDFEQEPDKLSQVQWAALSAADYWDDKKLNKLADQGEFTTITQKINGGLNGLDDRLARLSRVTKVIRPGLEDSEPQSVAASSEPAAAAVASALDASAAPAATQKGNTMLPMFIAAALPAIIELVPKLGAMFADSKTAERNVAAATIIANVAKEAIGAANEQELVEKIASDPAAAQAVKKAVEENWFRIEEVGGGIQAARAANEKYLVNTSGGPQSFMYQPAFWITLLLLPLAYFVVYRVLVDHEAFTSEVQSMVIGAVLSGVLSGISGYWLGTSFSSSRKTELLNEKSDRP